MTGGSPEYETHEVHLVCGDVITYRRCLHANTTPVHATNGELVARLCLDCDTQLNHP